MDEVAASEVAASEVAPDDGRGRGALRMFWRGLTTASMFSWIAAMAVCLVEFGVCCLIATPGRLADLNPKYIQEYPGDDYAILSLQLLKYRTAELTKLQVVYLGASQATRALESRSNPEVISRALTEEAGMPVEFQRFSSNTQRYEDALLIADQLPPSFRGVVVLTVTDYKRDYKPKDTPKEEAEEEARLADRLLAIDAPSLAPVWAKHHFRRRPTGVFFVDHLRFFAARRIAALPFFFTTRPELPAGQLIGDPMADADRVEKAAQRITKAYGVFRRPAPILTQSREVLRRTLDNLRARGIQVVVLEAITNPLREVIDAEGHIERYRSEVAEFAEEHGAVYWDFNADLDFAPEDFQDDVHLGSQAARRKFQHTLVSALAALIVKDFPDGMATEVTAPGP